MTRIFSLISIGAIGLLATALFLTPLLDKMMKPDAREYTPAPRAEVQAHVYVIPWDVTFNVAPTPHDILQRAPVLTFRDAAAEEVAQMIAKAQAEAKPSSHEERFPEMRWGVVITRNGVPGESIFFGALHRFMRTNQKNYEAPPRIMDFMECLAPLLDPSLPLHFFRQQRPQPGNDETRSASLRRERHAVTS